MERQLNNYTYIENPQTVPVLRFNAFKGLDWLNCGFSTRLGGVSNGCHEALNLGFERGVKYENVVENFSRFASSAGFDPQKICLPSQWHTNNIRIAGKNDCAGNPELVATGSKTPDKVQLNLPKKNDDPEKRIQNAIDGQITDEKEIVLIAYGADCTPVYLADPVHHAIGLVHSGWKGTLNSISADAVRMMHDRYLTDPKDIIAVIGPSIGSDNYEVGYDVAEHFINKHNINVTETSSIVRKGNREDKYQLDLWEANRINLTEAGLKDENISISGLCTFEEKELFYSHRRDGNARGVMAAFMSIRE